MDVGSGKGYPNAALSNFSPHPFVIDGVQCASMEGFLQSLKFESQEMQVEVCKLVGYAAKKKGSKKNWYVDQTLYWRGIAYKRDSKGYQNLLNKAYMAMFLQSESFRNALKAAGKDAVFTHTIGNTDSSKTVLTRSEFCRRLMNLKYLLFTRETELFKK